MDETPWEILKNKLEWNVSKNNQINNFILQLLVSLFALYTEDNLYQFLGPVQTSNFTCAESNANEQEL